MISLESKIKIDRILFGGAAYILDRLSLIIGKFLKRDHSISNENVKNVVIAKYLGLGSIVRSQVIINDIKNTFPNAKIYYLTSIKNKQIFDIIENVENVLTIDDSKVLKMIFSTINLILNLIKIKVDAFIDLEVYSRYSSCIAILSCARNRYGFFRHDVHWHIGVYTHMLYFNNQKNITDIYLQISNYFTKSNIYDKSIPKFKFKNKYIIEVEDYLLNKFGKKLCNDIFIGINANASELALERRYPPDYFVELIENFSMIEEKNIRIFLVGSPTEKEYLQKEIYDKLSEHSKSKVFIIAGTFSLNAAIYFLSKLDLFITTDSGPLHFAYAQNINIISIWGPCSHLHYSVNGYKNDIPINSNVYCHPCIHLTIKPPCEGNNICLKTILPKTIFNFSIKSLNLKYNYNYNKMYKIQYDDYFLGSVIRY